uniref:C2 domain-containing protein n=1 Tax=Parastrongyloides trichosuri TaxID=131310 RepID=A0A0N5A3T7_PARTI
MAEEYLNTSEMLDFQISCTNLPMESYSGCKVVGFVKTSETYKQFFDSGVFMNNINPVFDNMGSIIYHFEGMQMIRFIIYSVDPVTNTENYTIGESFVNLHDLMVLGGAANTKVVRDETKIDPKQADSLIRVRAIKSKKDLATLIKIRASGLSSLNEYPLSPYFTVQVYDKEETNNIGLLHKSEIKRNERNPEWKSFVILTKYFNLFKDSMIKITLYNYNPNTMDSLIGSFDTTFFQLLQGQALKFSLNNKAGAKINNMAVDIQEFKPYEMPSFFDIVTKEKMGFFFSVAIDFSSFNRSTTDPNGCHSEVDDKKSDYLEALECIFNDLTQRGPAEKICVFGFGARPKNSSKTSHLIPLVCEQTNKSYFKNFNNLQNSYRKFLKNYQLSDECDYSEVIHYIRGIAKAAQTQLPNERSYFVLIIMTHGVVKHNRKIIDAIVACSTLPISVIIVPIENDVNYFPKNNNDKFNNIFLPQIKNSDNSPLLREVITLVQPSMIKEHKLSKLVLQNIPRHVESWAFNYGYKKNL